jgi:hypothetical protein
MLVGGHDQATLYSKEAMVNPWQQRSQRLQKMLPKI